MEPQLSGLLFADYVEALRAVGLFEKVRDAVTPDVRGLMDTPPAHDAWLPIRQADVLLSVATDLSDPPMAARLGLEVSRRSLSKLLPPFGHERSPARLFAQAGLRLTAMMRGLTIRFREVGTGAGQLVVEFSEPVARVRLVAWAGAARAAIERCGLVATVGEPQIDPDLRRCEVPLRWTAQEAAH